MLSGSFNTSSRGWFKLAMALQCWLWMSVIGFAGPHDAFLGGPWEITVKIGLEGNVLHFPISVKDENRAQSLNQVLPVMGTPIKLHFEHYIPDLGWETTAVKSPKGGYAARLRFAGNQLDQTFWLQSRERSRRIISSPIGGIEMKELRGKGISPAFLDKLADRATVGVLSLWEPSQERPIDIAVQPGEVVTLPDEQGTLSVLKYMPHYSVDRVTKVVRNQSDQPLNPALEISLRQGVKVYKRWVWAQFAVNPHESSDFPLRVEFSNYYLGKTDGKYLLIVGQDTQARLLFYRNGAPVLEVVKPEHSYAFARAGYRFKVEEIIPDTLVKKVWTNRSDRLIRPALVGTFDTGRLKKEVVLEFNKPYHYKTEYGTLVMVYRQRTPSSELSP